MVRLHPSHRVSLRRATQFMLVPSSRMEGTTHIRHHWSVNPVFRLDILAIVDLLGWVERRVEVFKKGPGFGGLVVDLDFISLVVAGTIMSRVRKVKGKTYLMIRVYRFVSLSVFGIGGFLRCFSWNSPVRGFLCRMMR